MIIGLIKEGKQPQDNRVALTPSQCRWLQNTYKGLKVLVQSSNARCFIDQEYARAGIDVVENLNNCDLLLGIKEVAINELIPEKTYMFFSHTRKKQPYNRLMLKSIMDKKISLIDYECMEHKDGQRIIGFGFFAGIVGAHNGMMVYGNRTGDFFLDRVYKQRDFKNLIRTYFGLKVPPIKIAITGSGRVAHGVLEIMNLLGIFEIEKEDFLNRNFDYPVYVQLKGNDLYRHKKRGNYNREDFHKNAQDYECLFHEYIQHTDILMNGIFWDVNIPRLFRLQDVSDPNFRIQVIADITDDNNGSIPINLGDQSIEYPVYGVDKQTFKKTPPHLLTSVDVMAVGNLPNELPRDASNYFGEQLIKYILPDLLTGKSEIIEKATIVKNGNLTLPFEYLKGYAFGNEY